GTGPFGDRVDRERVVPAFDQLIPAGGQDRVFEFLPAATFHRLIKIHLCILSDARTLPNGRYRSVSYSKEFAWLPPQRPPFRAAPSSLPWSSSPEGSPSSSTAPS